MIDCTTYENCPKAKQFVIKINSRSVNFLFMGCWGVFCSQQKNYAGKHVADLMSSLSSHHKIQGVILAGDNIYPYSKYKNPTKQKPPHEDYPNSTYKKIMNDQLKRGFSRCFKNIHTNEFLVAVGNHDIEKCVFINTQINYTENKWKFPALYYNKIYNLKNGTVVNLIFIDTNLYTSENYCDNKQFPGKNNEQLAQYNWLKKTLLNNINSWNIVIGHVPFMYNVHKKTMINGMWSDLALHILSLTQYIDLYCSADEHNQQFIISPFFPPSVIAGSGGNILDPLYKPEVENILSVSKSKTLFAISQHGCVLFNIDEKFINIEIHGLRNVSSFKINKSLKRNRNILLHTNPSEFSNVHTYINNNS